MSAEVWVPVGLALLGALGSVAWWLLRHVNSRVDQERQGREQDRHALRDDIATVAGRLQAHELHVAREYVSGSALEKAMKPLQDSVNRVEGTLERLFGELKGKQDKPGAGD